MSKERVFLCGDVHGVITCWSSSKWPEGRTLNKNDVLIQLGDFGILWSLSHESKSNEKYWMGWLGEKPWTTLVVPGNHDNHDTIEDLPISEKWGGKVRCYQISYGKSEKTETVYFAVPGEIYTINDKKFLAIPKALSIDKAFRTEGISYWKKELLSKQEEEDILNSLDKANWQVDYLLSHTVADSVIPAFLDDPNSPKFNDPVSKLLEFVCNKLEFTGNFFGHFHNSREFIDAAGDYYKCLMHEIIELDQAREDDIIQQKEEWSKARQIQKPDEISGKENGDSL
jgi:hypothetical protein